MAPKGFVKAYQSLSIYHITVLIVRQHTPTNPSTISFLNYRSAYKGVLAVSPYQRNGIQY